jgi:hypothetical protein
MQEFAREWIVLPAVIGVVSAALWAQVRPSMKLRKALNTSDQRTRSFHRH